MCIRCKNKIIRYFVWIFFRRLLWRHRKTLNIKAEKPKFYSSTVLYFTLANLLETNKVQEAKFRDCHWCISIHFASVYFDENKAVGCFWQSKSTIFGHQAKAIAFAKLSLWVKNSKGKKTCLKRFYSTLQLFYAKKLEKTANIRKLRPFWKLPKMATDQRL